MPLATTLRKIVRLLLACRRIKLFSVCLAAMCAISLPYPASAQPTWTCANGTCTPSGYNIGIGSGMNLVYDGVAGARPLIVQKADSNTNIGASLANLVIVNADTTAQNSSQLSFATLNAANSTIQHVPAAIS